MIFEEMKSAGQKEAFLKKRREAVNSNPAETEKLAAYVLSDRFDGDVQRLIDGDYYFDPPVLILLRKGQSDRRRKVYRFAEENKMLLQYLTFMLLERYDERFPDTLYSFRKNNQTGKLFRTIRREDPHREKFILKADIHSFGESIDPEILGERLRPWLADEPELYSFILWLITRNLYYRDGQLEEGFTSVLPGNPIVPFLQNVFLLDVDRMMRENVQICCRYTDDICMICEDGESAERLLRQLEEMTGRAKLTLNPEKTGIVPPGAAYDLLGLHFAPDTVDLSDNTYHKVCCRMKHRAESIGRRVRKGVLTRETGLRMMAGFIRAYYYGTDEERRISWTNRFFPYLSTTERLNRLDHLSQECFRYIATGRRTNAKYRFRYVDIRATGYVPLVRAYYSRLDNRSNPEQDPIRHNSIRG